MFCLWIKGSGQQGALLQTDPSLRHQSGATPGKVSGSSDPKFYGSMVHSHYLINNILYMTSSCSFSNFPPFILSIRGLVRTVMGKRCALLWILSILKPVTGSL